MQEGSLQAPIRHIIDWEDDAFYNENELDKELRRVFDICHGCRRCFNLCDSFPALFDLIDATPQGECEEVQSKDFSQVVDACTLCDLCFVNKCPYVPPHQFDVDFPHLMLRYRAVQAKTKGIGFIDKQLSKTDQIGPIAVKLAPAVNWATSISNTPIRHAIEQIAGIDAKAELPTYANKTLCQQAALAPYPVNKNGPAYGQKAVLFATCFGNYNNPAIGLAALKVLAHQGIHAELVYPGCCGMPLLEKGDLKSVAEQALKISNALELYVQLNIPIISIIPSCSLMLKSEWPLLLPKNPQVINLSKQVMDISEYVMSLHKKYSLEKELKPLENQTVTLHLACHSRAQNIGAKAAEMLRLIPNLKVEIIERCSGHGGTWGMMKAHFKTALKVGKPTAKQAIAHDNPLVLSECPLAAKHILQGINIQSSAKAYSIMHPIELMAQSYGI